MKTLINIEDEGMKPSGRTNFNAAALMNDMLGIDPGTSKNGVVDIPIDELVPRKGHRFHPSPQGKRELMKDSIKLYGVVQPVMVRPAEECAYQIDGKYEIIAGHQRTSLCQELGILTIPCIVVKGKSEEDVEQLVSITNFQRSWEEMTISERAAILADFYTAVKNKGQKGNILDEINSYLETYANPDNTGADGVLSHGETRYVETGIRAVAEEYNLSRATIARYIRIHHLIDDLKPFVDTGAVSLIAGVELSYLLEDNQVMLAQMLTEDGYKCNVKKGQLLRELQEKKKLNHVTMREVLADLRKKASPGKPKPFKVNGSIYTKYFTPEQKQKEIDEIIDKALELYFMQT